MKKAKKIKKMVVKVSRGPNQMKVKMIASWKQEGINRLKMMQNQSIQEANKMMAKKMEKMGMMRIKKKSNHKNQKSQLNPLNHQKTAMFVTSTKNLQEMMKKSKTKMRKIKDKMRRRRKKKRKKEKMDKKNQSLSPITLTL